MLSKLFKQWKISHLVFEKDTDAYARDRDEDVMRQAKEVGVEVIVKVGRTLYDPDELVKANGGKPTMSISQVEHVCSYLLLWSFRIRADDQLGCRETRGSRKTYSCTYIPPGSW